MFKKRNIRSLENAIKKMQKRTEGELLKDFTVEIKNKSMKFDYIFVTKSYVIIIDTIDYIGELYGEKKANVWALHEKEYKTPVDNPIKIQEEQIALLRILFPKEDVYNVTIENYVVFLTKPKNFFLSEYFSFIKQKCLVFYGKIENCLYLKDFKKLISSDKYLEDKNLKPKKVKEAIEKYIKN